VTIGHAVDSSANVADVGLLLADGVVELAQEVDRPRGSPAAEAVRGSTRPSSRE
jgi:hypothetical protein